MNKRHRAEDATRAIREPEVQAVERAAWRVAEWCRAVGCCRSTFYTLVNSGAIRTVKLGWITLVTTAPGDFVANLPSRSPRLRRRLPRSD